MRLLNTTTLQLELFIGEPPRYAVLSHRWDQGEEITFDDMKSSENIRLRRGYKKLQVSAFMASQYGFEYIWIDTCCIDKSSSAELSEAINSMFQWYRRAEMCLAYLADTSSLEDLDKSEWFRRGWTLQELVAPKNVRFFNDSWESLGDKYELKGLLHTITGISEGVLLGTVGLDTVPACNKMAWAAGRATTRPEDMAYCLMGLFNVNMPLLYGEGAEKAFGRLQEEFIRTSDDESIFAWTAEPAEVDASPYWGLLAPSPQCFKRSRRYTIPRFKAYRYGRPTEITNYGIRTSLTLQPLEKDVSGTLFIAALNCSYHQDEADEFSNSFTITLQKLSDFEDQYARVRPDAVIPVGEPSGTHWPRVDSQTESQISQIFVRLAPRLSDAVAGFCVPGSQFMPFEFMAGSNRGPVAIPGHVEAVCAGDAEDVDGGLNAGQFCVLDVTAAEDNGTTKLDVQSLRGRQIVGCAKMEFVGRLDDRRPPGDRINPVSSYRDPYLVVGLESLPDNFLGTPPGYLRPWYAFSQSCRRDDLEMLLSQEKLVTSHTAPGGAFVQAQFKTVTHRFKTYYEVNLINTKWKQAS